MNGDADIPHRSSSPLKRRASSMDPDNQPENHADKPREAELNAAPSQAAATGELPRAMSIDPPESTAPVPSLLEQVKIIETLLKAFAEAPLKEGDLAYLVSRTWVEKALALRGDSKDAKKEPPTEPLGPVDNSDIIEDVVVDPVGNKFIRLKPESGLESFELFPGDAWKMVVDWYGLKEGQEPIIRTAINTTTDATDEPNIMYEFHPPIFRVHRLWSEVSPLPIEQSLKAKNPPPLVIPRSRKYHAMTFLKELKDYSDVPADRKIRLWTITQTIPAATASSSEKQPALTPPDSPGRPESQSTSVGSWSNMLVDVASFSALSDEKTRVPLVDRTAEANYNGKTTFQFIHLVSDQILLIDEAIDRDWVSTYTGRTKGGEKSIPTRSSGLTSANASGRSSPTLGGPLTRGRMQKKTGRSVGAVGLQNLGNTCYMNSALQCVRSVEELTKYFLTGTYSEEVNKTNPLGYNGKVAMAYGNLLREIYLEGRGSVSPRDFKTTVGRCRSTFSGWGQQDSQEFLGFLLDGLQEDLSRIKKKPYIEKPDSTDDMINNPEAIKEMADKVWDITRRRDDSVIADLFTGMYKSTLKCPECGKISITFDPFNNLTLPIPVADMWTRSVKFFPLNDVPVNIEVELPKHSAMEQLKQFLSIRTGVPVERMMGAEEFKDRFFKIYDNTHDVSEEIGSSDIPTMHELEFVPTNWPHKAKKKYRSMLDIDTPLESESWQDARYEKMVVPVFHRRPRSLGGRSQEGTSPPHFICLTKEEVSDMDAIRRKVLEKVATFSTWSKLRDTHDSKNSDNTDSEMVITTASDADSSGDSKVVASSVEGEEDMVDITMKDANSPLPHQPQLLKRFNAKRPGFIQSEEFLDPELQNLFELSYFTDHSDSGVPTGWSNVDPSQTLPKLADRIAEPEPETPEDEDAASPETSNSTGSGNDDSTNDESSKAESSNTRMMDESSEDDTVPEPIQNTGRPKSANPGAGRKKFKGHRTYGKKGNKRRDKQVRGKAAQKLPAVKPQPTPPAKADGGPLIRLGEGLVVDWNEDAWETVFGGSASDTEEDQGTRTFMDPEVLHDPALKVSQRRRNHRRARGITLEECLDEFERAEVLSEQDMWYCPRCKEHRRASKKFDLWKTPDILVAHLKRFSSSGWRRDKLDVLVDFPIEGLDLISRVIQKEDGKDEIYDLIAVDDHYGGLGGGHYTAYAKNFVDGRWYNYNDSSVSQVSDPSSAVTSAAYLLFYRRRSSSPLGGSRFGVISEKYDAEEDDDEDDEEAGEGRRLGEGSSLTGSPSAGSGAVATRPRADRGSDRVTTTSLAGPDDDIDPPPYEGPSRIETVRDSIEEDEGVDVKPHQPFASKSLSLTQAWSFDGIGGSGADDSTAADIGSDDVQVDSSDERGLSQATLDQDTEMTSHDERGDRSSTDVAEIHLEDDKDRHG